MQFTELAKGTRGRVWEFAGTVLVVSALPGAILIVWSSMVLSHGAGRGEGSVVIVVAMLLAGGVACIRYGRRLAVASAEELLSKDARAPVLYLRSFEQDDMEAYFRRSRFPALVELETEEVTLARVMGQIGPFICIGKPGEELPELGAARTYAAHSNWKDKVNEILHRARLAVFRFGMVRQEFVFFRPTSSQGVVWELQRATEILKPQQLLLLLGFSTSEEYEGFRRSSREYFPRPLPDFPKPGIFNKFYQERINALIYFDHDWTPHIARLRGKKRKTKLATELERLLEPVASGMGVHWKRPITMRRRAILIGISILLLLLAAFASLWQYVS